MKKKNHNRSVSLELLTRVGTSRGKPKRLEAIASRSQRGWEARRAQVHADSRCQVRCTSAYVPRNSPLFFSPLSLSLSPVHRLVGEGGRGAEGRLHKPRESEYGTQERHAQVHRFAEREWNEIYSTHLRGRICVYAYAPAAPRGHWHWRGWRRKGRSFQFFLLPSRPAGSRDSRRRIRGRAWGVVQALAPFYRIHKLYNRSEDTD